MVSYAVKGGKKCIDIVFNSESRWLLKKRPDKAHIREREKTLRRNRIGEAGIGCLQEKGRAVVNTVSAEVIVCWLLYG